MPLFIGFLSAPYKVVFLIFKNFCDLFLNSVWIEDLNGPEEGFNQVGTCSFCQWAAACTDNGRPELRQSWCTPLRQSFDRAMRRTGARRSSRPPADTVAAGQISQVINSSIKARAPSSQETKSPPRASSSQNKFEKTFTLNSECVLPGLT